MRVYEIAEKLEIPSREVIQSIKIKFPDWFGTHNSYVVNDVVRWLEEKYHVESLGKDPEQISIQEEVQSSINRIELNGEWEPLWCPRCQCGIIGMPDYKKYSAGDACPKCVLRASHGGIRKEDVSELWTVAEYQTHYLEQAKIEKDRRTKNAPKHIKDAGDLVRDLDEKKTREMAKMKRDYESRILDLEAKLTTLLRTQAEPKKINSSDPATEAAVNASE